MFNVSYLKGNLFNYSRDTAMSFYKILSQKGRKEKRDVEKVKFII